MRAERDVLPIQISGSGMVTSVGLSAAQSAAAIRAGISNPRQTRFIDWGGEWISAHVVALEALDARSKLLRMAATAIDECLAATVGTPAHDVALILCLADPPVLETQRPRPTLAISDVADALDLRFSSHSQVLALGRAGGLVALHHARTLLHEGTAQAVIVAGVDSYIDWPQLSGLEEKQRLLTSTNSNGFMPGEAAAAVLVTRPGSGSGPVCKGLGFASERATLDSGQPLRGDGLTQAVLDAADEARCGPQDFDLRISALSGEHYYFKEAALTLTRLVRTPKDETELWHPADCVGETGAAAGPLVLAVAAAASAKRYLPGPRILCHLSSDSGARAAAFLHCAATP